MDARSQNRLGWGRATDGHSTDWRGTGDQVGRRERKFCATGNVAALLSLRRVQRRGRCHGQPVQESGQAIAAAGISAAARRAGRRLRHSTHLGRRPRDGALFIRVSAEGGGAG